MFKKKKAISPPGRYRPTLRSEDRNAAVFSYHASRSARPTQTSRNERPPITAASKERHNTQHKWFKRAPFIAGLIIALVFVGLNVPVNDDPEVVAAQDARGGIFLRPSAAYTTAVHTLLASSIRNTNKLTIDTHALEHDLRTQFPELARVTVSLPLMGTRPTVYLEPTTPTLILTTTTSDVYVLDNTGRALIRAAQVPGLSKLGLAVVKDESPLPVTLGQGVLPGSNVAFITEVAGQLKAKQIAVESLTLPVSTSQLDMKVKDVPYTVKFNLMGNARAEVGTFLAVKQKLEREHKVPGSYIDVRVEERAYYR